MSSEKNIENVVTDVSQEQREEEILFNDIVEGMFEFADKTAKNENDVFDWIKENAKNEDDRMKLWAMYEVVIYKKSY